MGAEKSFSAQQLQNEKVQNKLFMKITIKLLARLLMVTLFLTFIGCSEDIYENRIHNKPIQNNKDISFEQFKKETGLRDFKKTTKITSSSYAFARNTDGSNELSDFDLDTDIIKRLAELNILIYVQTPIIMKTFCKRID